MQKTLLYTIVILIIFSGCGPLTAVQGPWYEDLPQSEDYFFAKGFDDTQELADAKKRAVEKAIESLLYDINDKIGLIITDAVQASMENDMGKGRFLVQDVSDRLKNSLFSSIETKEYHYSEKGGIFALVQISVKKVRSEAEKAFRDVIISYPKIRKSGAEELILQDIETLNGWD